jgi:hypothetical protein
MLCAKGASSHVNEALAIHAIDHAAVWLALRVAEVINDGLSALMPKAERNLNTKMRFATRDVRLERDRHRNWVWPVKALQF